MSHRLALVFLMILSAATTAIAQQPAPATRSGLVTLRVFEIPSNEPFLTDHPVLSPDGKCVSFGVLDGTKQRSVVTIYDTNSGKAIYQTDGPRGDAFGLAQFSPDSTKAAFVRTRRAGYIVDSNFVEVIDLTNGRILHTFDAAPGLASGLILFTPDGGSIIFPAKRPAEDPHYDKEVFVAMNLRTGNVSNTYLFNSYDGLQAISPDGSILVSWEGEIWDERTSSKIAQLDWPRNHRPVDVCFLSGGKQFRALYRDFSVRTWEVQSGKLVEYKEPRREYRRRLEGQFAVDGQHYFLATGRSILMFDVAMPEPVAEWSPELPEHWYIRQFTTRPGGIFLEKRREALTEMAVMRFPARASFTAVKPTTKPASKTSN
jgi:WD40 repeat protein